MSPALTTDPLVIPPAHDRCSTRSLQERGRDQPRHTPGPSPRHARAPGPPVHNDLDVLVRQIAGEL